jgi:dipeptide/tripeptide permease
VSRKASKTITSQMNLVYLPAIFLLYLNHKLKFDASVSTAIFHFNELISFIATIFGAVVADSLLGLHKTITWMTLVFSIGSCIVSFGAIELLNLPAR